MEVEEIISILMGIVALFLLISGIRRIIKRRAIITRWRYEHTGWAYGKKQEITGCRVVFGGIIRLVIAGVLIFLIIMIMSNR